MARRKPGNRSSTVTNRRKLIERRLKATRPAEASYHANHLLILYGIFIGLQLLAKGLTAYVGQVLPAFTPGTPAGDANSLWFQILLVNTVMALIVVVYLKRVSGTTVGWLEPPLVIEEEGLRELREQLSAGEGGGASGAAPGRSGGRVLGSLEGSRLALWSVAIGATTWLGTSLVNRGLLYGLAQVGVVEDWTQTQHLAQVYGGALQAGALGAVTALTLVIVFAAPVVEELFFRRSIIPILETREMPLGLIVFLSALLFVPAHSDQIIAARVLLAAVVYAVAYIKTRRLLVPVLMHVTNNLLAVIAVLLQFPVILQP